MSEIVDDALKGVKGARTALKYALKVAETGRFGPGFAKLAENTALKTLAAKSPIISAAQAAILAMMVTLGYPFVPEDGDRIEGDSKVFENLVKALSNANPDAAWEGAGADAYASHNEKQKTRAEQLVEIDAEVRRIIAEEAHQIVTTRRTLADIANWLTAYDLATCWMYAFPPEGPAAKQGLDIAAVAAVMPTVYQKYSAMISDAGRNSSGLQNAIAQYNGVASSARIS